MEKRVEWPLMALKHIIYVSSSVSNASREYRDFIRRFKQELRDRTAALVIEWVEQDAALPDDFFKKNINNVHNCDAMIAITNEPSIGVGMEIQEAINNDKPLLCLHENGLTVSRLLASAKQAGKINFELYDTMDHAVDMATSFIESLPR
jgi:hypothetical protein